MQWRLMPDLQPERVAGTRCLLLGAGTLGCAVARSLLAWGVQHLTFVDSGRVSYSNPVRQSLFTVADCQDGGKFKAPTAAERVREIAPGVSTSGEVLTIPMPGHAVATSQLAEVRSAVEKLTELVASHDVVFLLTDSRESRWLPTLLCSATAKPTLNVALGFDSFLVMRYGVHPSKQRLGCYFCNDVVAPQNSLRDRTLDQQCTVTRPGLSPMASSVAVEMLINLLHHPEGFHAPPDDPVPISSPVPPFGLIPHSIRGYLAHFSNLIVNGQSYDKCTACSDLVVNEYKERGFEFLLEAFNSPTYLEDLTGLTKMKEDEVEWEVEEEGDWDM